MVEKERSLRVVVVVLVVFASIIPRGMAHWER
jgi:hypothetical protein